MYRLSVPSAALAGCASSISGARGLHSSGWAFFPRSSIGGGQPGPEDPVKDIKQGAQKVKEAASGDKDAAGGLLQDVKGMAGWAAGAVKSTVNYTLGNINNIASNTKADVKKAVDPNDPPVDLPKPGGPGTQADHILQRDFTEQANSSSSAGSSSFESRMGGQPAGSTLTQPGAGGVPQNEQLRGKTPDGKEVMEN